jgi:hypothetical protein
VDHLEDEFGGGLAQSPVAAVQGDRPRREVVGHVQVVVRHHGEIGRNSQTDLGRPGVQFQERAGMKRGWNS